METYTRRIRGTGSPPMPRQRVHNWRRQPRRKITSSSSSSCKKRGRRNRRNFLCRENRTKQYPNGSFSPSKQRQRHQDCFRLVNAVHRSYEHRLHRCELESGEAPDDHHVRHARVQSNLPLPLSVSLLISCANCGTTTTLPWFEPRTGESYMRCSSASAPDNPRRHRERKPNIHCSSGSAPDNPQRRRKHKPNRKKANAKPPTNTRGPICRSKDHTIGSSLGSYPINSLATTSNAHNSSRSNSLQSISLTLRTASATAGKTSGLHWSAACILLQAGHLVCIRKCEPSFSIFEHRGITFGHQSILPKSRTTIAPLVACVDRRSRRHSEQGLSHNKTRRRVKCRSSPKNRDHPSSGGAT